jgi:hypothetical protein
MWVKEGQDMRKIKIDGIEEDEWGGEWEIVIDKNATADVVDYIFEIMDRKLKLDFFDWSSYIARKCKKVAEKLGLRFIGFSEPDVVEEEYEGRPTYPQIYYYCIFAKGDKQIDAPVVEIDVTSFGYDDAQIRIATENFIEKILRKRGGV